MSPSSLIHTIDVNGQELLDLEDALWVLGHTAIDPALQQVLDLGSDGLQGLAEQVRRLLLLVVVQLKGTGALGVPTPGPIPRLLDVGSRPGHDPLQDPLSLGNPTSQQ